MVLFNAQNVRKIMPNEFSHCLEFNFVALDSIRPIIERMVKMSEEKMDCLELTFSESARDVLDEFVTSKEPFFVDVEDVNYFHFDTTELDLSKILPLVSKKLDTIEGNPKTQSVPANLQKSFCP